MRPYVIVGAGAIGGTLGHHLARAGHPVTVVDADPEHVRRIGADGLVVVRGAERSTRPGGAGPHPGSGRAGAAPGAGPARGEGAGHRPGAGLDRAPAGRRRVRRVAAERAERGRDRAPDRSGPHGRRVREPLRRRHRAGGDPRRRAGRPRRRRARRPRQPPGPRGRRRPAGVGSGPGHRQRLRLPVVEAGVRRHARRDRARRRPDGRADRPAPGGDARAGRRRSTRSPRRRGSRWSRSTRSTRCPTRATTTSRRSGPPTRSSPGCARRRRTAAASGATSRSGAGPPRSPRTTARCSPPPRGTASRCPAWSGWSPRSASWRPVRRWTRPASPPSPERCGDRGAAAVRGRRRRRRRAAPLARRPASRSSWTTWSPTPSWRRRATTSRC